MPRAIEIDFFAPVIPPTTEKFYRQPLIPAGDANTGVYATPYTLQRISGFSTSLDLGRIGALIEISGTSGLNNLIWSVTGTTAGGVKITEVVNNSSTPAQTVVTSNYFRSVESITIIENTIDSPISIPYAGPSFEVYGAAITPSLFTIPLPLDPKCIQNQLTIQGTFQNVTSCIIYGTANPINAFSSMGYIKDNYSQLNWFELDAFTGSDIGTTTPVTSIMENTYQYVPIFAVFAELKTANYSGKAKVAQLSILQQSY
jgi:hypothetical protein